MNRKAVQEMQLPERTGASNEALEMTETMNQLERVWRDVIGTNMGKLGFPFDPSTNFFSVGRNSLLIIRLQARIRQVFRVVVPLVKLMNDNTLGEMARSIEESTSVEIIDWEHETSPSLIPNFLEDVPPKTEAAKKTILVTGATGFVGKYVLPQLADRSDIEKIYCVAVREKPRQSEFLTASNIYYHSGDLAIPLLGLSEEMFRTLASEVDVIVHMGAVLSFWDNYHVLRPSNVESMKELVKLACPHHISIHYISTVGVLPRDAELSTLQAGSTATNVPSSESGNCYIASKWAGERILERSAEMHGIPSWIYRFLPASSMQILQKEELMDTFIRLVNTLGSTPDMGVWKGRVDLVPAEQVGNWLAASVAETITANTADTNLFHYESSISFHTDELSAHIAHLQKTERILAKRHS